MASKTIMLYDNHRKKTYNIGNYDIEELALQQAMVDKILDMWTKRYHPTAELEYKESVENQFDQFGFRNFKDFLYTINRLKLSEMPDVVILAEARELLGLKVKL